MQLQAMCIVEKVSKLLFLIKRNPRWKFLMFYYLKVGRGRLIVDNDWRYPMSLKKNPVERMDTGLLTEGNGLAQHNCIIMQNDFQTFKRSLLKWKLIGIFLPFLWDKSHLSGKQAIEQKGFMPSENILQVNKK